MPHPDAEHSLRIHLATALRERDEARALAEKWAQREAAGVERGIRADADALSEIQGLQEALAAARRENGVLRERDGAARAMLTELRAALDDDATFLGAVLCVEMDKWLAAPAAAASTSPASPAAQGKEPAS